MLDAIFTTSVVELNLVVGPLWPFLNASRYLWDMRRHYPDVDVMAHMTSAERVKSAIEFRGPDCFPILNPYNPGASDIVFIGLEPTIWRWREVSPGMEECVDIFGCRRRRADREGIGEVVASPVASWLESHSYRCPGLDSLKDWIRSETHMLAGDKFVIGDLGQCLYKIFELRGFSETLVGLAADPAEAAHILDALTEFALRRIDLYEQTGQVHAVSVFDDWGTQETMLISPDTWKDLFLDRYGRIFSRAHEAGFHVYFHSCGAVGKIIPCLLGAGVDVLNFMQPSVHGVRNLWEKYGGRVAFACCVDEQRTLPTYDAEAIRQEAAELVAALHHNGGFIACIEGLGFDRDRRLDGFDLVQFTEQVFGELRESTSRDSPGDRRVQAETREA